MPKKYEDIKQSEMKQGRSEKDAERIAAATYNKERKPGQKPVTRDYDKHKGDITQIEVLDGNGKTVGIRP